MLMLRMLCAGVLLAPLTTSAQVQSAAKEKTYGKTPLILPRPTGEFAIGVRSLYFVDRSRSDTLAATPNQPRELSVTVWYPAVPGRSPSPYMSTDYGGPVSRDWNLIHGFEARIQTHASASPRFSPRGPFPVVLLEHGSGVVPQEYSLISEDLASHGFVVVAINHTFGSTVTMLSKHRMVPFKEYWPAKADRNAQGIAIGEYVRVWVADAAFVMDELERLNQADPIWRGQLDLTRIGIAGHSYGATSAVLIGEQDKRIRAVINLDGSLYPGMSRPRVLPQPFMIITTGDHTSNHELFDGPAGNSYHVTLSGTDHMTFTDFHVIYNHFAADSTPSEAERIKGIRDMQAVRSLVTEFFSKYLKGEVAPWLDSPIQIKKQ